MTDPTDKPAQVDEDVCSVCGFQRHIGSAVGCQEKHCHSAQQGISGHAGPMVDWMARTMALTALVRTLGDALLARGKAVREAARLLREAGDELWSEHPENGLTEAERDNPDADFALAEYRKFCEGGTR